MLPSLPGGNDLFPAGLFCRAAAFAAAGFFGLRPGARFARRAGMALFPRFRPDGLPGLGGVFPFLRGGFFLRAAGARRGPIAAAAVAFAARKIFINALQAEPERDEDHDGQRPCDEIACCHSASFGKPAARRGGCPRRAPLPGEFPSPVSESKRCPFYMPSARAIQ